MARAPQVTFVIAAGNDEKDAADVIPAALSSQLPNAITVGGTHSGDEFHIRNFYSNYGSVITLGASYSVWGVDLQAEGSYKYLYGTSFSAPMVTGAVGLLKAVNPTLRPGQIKQILVTTGPVINMCHPEHEPCTLEDQDRWPILDAGEAVSSVIWPSIDAAIDLDGADLSNTTTGSRVELAIPVVNTGSKEWTFYLSVEATSPSKKVDALGPVQNTLAPGESLPFTVHLEGDEDGNPVEVGRWILKAQLYRNPELTSSPDLRSFRLQVVPGEESLVEDPADTENSRSSLFPSRGEQNVPNEDPGKPEVPSNDSPAGAGYGSVKGDREALVAIYNATDGENWNRSDNWLSDAPLDEWEGVTTDDEGRVTKLEVNGNDLSGEIPAELGNLTSLEGLQLHNNQLTGAIPAELGSLTNLTHLYLSGNQLTGAIPTELGNLANLQTLYLHRNQLTGTIPAELGSLPSLQSLWLYDNQLTGEIPAELGSLPSLQSLWLQGNQLTGEIPAELGSLTNLRWLWLYDNQLTGAIPAELGNLTNLTHLYLSGNQLTGCRPAGLRDIRVNDFGQLGLPFCGS